MLAKMFASMRCLFDDCQFNPDTQGCTSAFIGPEQLRAHYNAEHDVDVPGLASRDTKVKIMQEHRVPPSSRLSVTRQWLGAVEARDFNKCRGKVCAVCRDKSGKLHKLFLSNPAAQSHKQFTLKKDGTCHELVELRTACVHQDLSKYLPEMFSFHVRKVDQSLEEVEESVLFSVALAARAPAAAQPLAAVTQARPQRPAAEVPNSRPMAASAPAAAEAAESPAALAMVAPDSAPAARPAPLSMLEQLERQLATEATAAPQPREMLKRAPPSMKGNIGGSRGGRSGTRKARATKRTQCIDDSPTRCAYCQTFCKLQLCDVYVCKLYLLLIATIIDICFDSDMQQRPCTRR